MAPDLTKQTALPLRAPWPPRQLPLTLLTSTLDGMGTVTERGVQRRLAAILAADVVGYSRMIGLDETGTLARLRQIRHEIVNPVLAEHGGRIFKLMGDGLLAEFPSAVLALRAAIAIQEGLANRNAEATTT